MNDFINDDRQAIPFDEIEAELGLGEHQGSPRKLSNTEMTEDEGLEILRGSEAFRLAPAALFSELQELKAGSSTNREDFARFVQYADQRLMERIREEADEYDEALEEAAERFNEIGKEEIAYQAELREMEAEEAAREAAEAKAEAIQAEAEAFLRASQEVGLDLPTAQAMLHMADVFLEQGMEPNAAMQAAFRAHEEANRVADEAHSEIPGTGMSALEIAAALGDEFTIPETAVKPDVGYVLTGERQKDFTDEAIGRIAEANATKGETYRDEIERMAQAAAAEQAARQAAEGGKSVGYEDPATKESPTIGEFLAEEGIEVKDDGVRDILSDE